MKGGREEEQEEEKTSLIQGEAAPFADVLLRLLAGSQKKISERKEKASQENTKTNRKKNPSGAMVA